MKHILAALSCCLVAACATKPVAVSAAHDVPADRAIAFTSPADGSGTVTVVRDEGMTLSGCYLGVFINHQLAAKVGTGEKVTMYVPAGRWVMSAKSVGAGLCGTGLADRAERSVALVVERGDAQTYRLGADGQGTINLGPN